MKLAVLFAVVLTALCAPALPEGAAAAPRAAERVILPTDVRPERYEIRIVPDAAHLTFQGQARIAVEVLRPTRRIVLNAADLTVQRASLSGLSAAPRVQLDEA